MTVKEYKKLLNTFYKVYVEAKTSTAFQCPPMDKASAKIAWIEVSVLFNSAIDKAFPNIKEELENENH